MSESLALEGLGPASFAFSACFFLAPDLVSAKVYPVYWRRRARRRKRVTYVPAARTTCFLRTLSAVSGSYSERTLARIGYTYGSNFCDGEP